MEKFVRAGDTVLIKPNLTVYYSAEEGCTTDPQVVGALIILAKEAGAGKVIVGESSGEFFSTINCMEITGIAAVAEREGAEIVDLGSDETPTCDVRLPSGEIVPRPVPLVDADVIINVPKAKTHHYEPISGALKNWMGTCNQQWRFKHHGNDDSIARFVAIMAMDKPHLHVVDALIAGEGDGPIAKAGHCNKSSSVRPPLDENALRFEANRNDDSTFECCGFLPRFFDKVRKGENIQQVAALPARAESTPATFAFVRIKPNAFFRLPPA